MDMLHSDRKTNLKLRCDSCIKITAIRVYPVRCSYIDGCKLLVTTPENLHITPAKEECL